MNWWKIFTKTTTKKVFWNGHSPNYDKLTNQPRQFPLKWIRKCAGPEEAWQTGDRGTFEIRTVEKNLLTPLLRFRKYTIFSFSIKNSLLFRLGLLSLTWKLKIIQLSISPRTRMLCDRLREIASASLLCLNELRGIILASEHHGSL